MRRCLKASREIEAFGAPEGPPMSLNDDLAGDGVEFAASLRRVLEPSPSSAVRQASWTRQFQPPAFVESPALLNHLVLDPRRAAIVARDLHIRSRSQDTACCATGRIRGADGPGFGQEGEGVKRASNGGGGKGGLPTRRSRGGNRRGMSASCWAGPGSSLQHNVSHDHEPAIEP
jgi:hypothetical protein